MAQAYSPGLRVTSRTVVHKLRRLPLPGTVHVKVGDDVRAKDIVASTALPGKVTTINIARELNCQPGEVPSYMVKHEGDPVTAGEIVAESRSLWGLFHSQARSPVEGTIETVSPVTGQVLVRGKPLPVELEAYVDGRITEVRGDEACVVTCSCALVQGIIGVGGERYGALRMLVNSPDDALAPDMLTAEYAGEVVVGGSMADLDFLRRAGEIGVSGVVVGGVHDRDLDTLLGAPLGVAITGQEELPLTIMVTEGFGRIPMAARTFELLSEREGHNASINGATQIRAGVIRPEVIIAHAPADAASEPLSAEEVQPGLAVGSSIRLIREPYFGLIGTVSELPAELVEIETGAMVRILRARLADGSEVTVPRANVELIVS